MNKSVALRAFYCYGKRTDHFERLTFGQFKISVHFFILRSHVNYKYVKIEKKLIFVYL